MHMKCFRVNTNSLTNTLWCFIPSPVPGSPPYGLSYESVSPSEVNVTWMPPLLPNGVIIHYSLELWNSSHYLNLTSRTNYIHITHLRKYAHYRVVVQAHTGVGAGNYSSEPLNITTLEDGERGVTDKRKKWGWCGCSFQFQETPPLHHHRLTSSKGIWLNLTFL